MRYKKRSSAILLLAITATCLSAQTAQAAAAPPDKLGNIMFWILGIACAALFLVAMVYIIHVNHFLYKKVLDLEAAKSGVTLPQTGPADGMPAEDGFWTRLRKKYWEDAVPIEREAEIMSDHAYDGIRELDNRLPPWWVNLFLITIVWAVGYMWYYHWGGGGPLSGEEYQMEVETAKKEIAVALAGQSAAIDESNVTRLTDAEAVGEGALIFKNVCAACHGQNGEGTVGPNFTDEYWIHGGGIQDLFKVIKYGVPEKGMISWQAQLKPADMQKVASYILTLQGTNPPNPKAPQGVLWKEPAQDTTATK
ncbi:MAG: cbb3-type cytochrome c oxidase N-terminal domain-containing protein [Saprospiraceae bacterium]